MAWKLNIDDLALSSTGKAVLEEILDAYKESDNFKDFMLSDTMKGLYERAGTKFDKFLLEVQDNKAFNKFLDSISKTDTGASISDAIKERLEKIGEEYDPGIDIDDKDSIDLNDPKTLEHLSQYIDTRMTILKHPGNLSNVYNSEGEKAFAKLCDELQLNDSSIEPKLSEYEMLNIAGQHVQFVGECLDEGCARPHDEVMTSYSSAFADLGYSGEEHPSMAVYGDMLTTAQNYIVLCQEYDQKDVLMAYDSAISTLGFGDSDNHPDMEQTPGMMSVVQNYVALSRDYSEVELKNMYEYASEKTGVMLSDNMQDNIDSLKTIQNFVDEHFVRDKNPIPSVVKEDDTRSLSDILKEDSAEIQFGSEKDDGIVDFNDPETLKHLDSYINMRINVLEHPGNMLGYHDPEGIKAFDKLCDELKLNDSDIKPALSEREMLDIAGRHLQLVDECLYNGCEHSHDEAKEAYQHAFAELGYSDKEHPSMVVYPDMLITAQNHIALCQEYDQKDIFAAYDSAISTLGFGDPDNHPNIEQQPGMMSVAQNYIAHSRDYSEVELKNMYEYASEKTGAMLSDDMQDNIDSLKTIQNFVDAYFVQGKNPVPDVVAKDDTRLFSDILKDDSAEIQTSLEDIVATINLKEFDFEPKIDKPEVDKPEVAKPEVDEPEVGSKPEFEPELC